MEDVAATLGVRERAFAAADQLKLRRRTRPWRRRVRLLLLVLGILAGAVLVTTAVQATRARGELLQARTALEAGRAALVRNDLDPALQSFSTAEDHARTAARQLDGFVLRVAAGVPQLGRTVEVAREVAGAAAEVAAAGVELTVGALRLPEGVATLAPVDGAIPVRPLAEIAPAALRAHAHVTAALARVEATPDTGLFGSVRAARAELLGQLTQLRDLLESAVALTAELPAFLGADETRTYLFGAQSLAESRGTGGCICAYTVVTAERGRLDFGPFVTANTLTPSPLPGVAAPSAEFLERYGRFGSPGQLQQANFTPDFPSAAAAIAAMYEAATGDRLDGVIAADPYALQALMRVTGPVQVEELGLLTADRVVDVLSNDAYDVLPDSEARKRLLGNAATAALEAFLSEPVEPARAARALVESGGEGHLLLWSSRPAEQAAFVAAGIAGSLPPAEGVVLGVFGANTATNKADAYTGRTVHVSLRLLPDGSATAEVATTLTNETPATGLPIDVTGPNVEGLDAGDNETFLQTYCGATCAVGTTTRDGEAIDTEVGSELGLDVVASLERLATGATRELRTTFTIERAWTGDATAGRLELLFANQATVIPTRVRLDVVLPDGAVLHGSGPGTPQLVMADGFATWEGLPGPRTAFAVGFGRPRDLGSRLSDLLNRPL